MRNAPSDRGFILAISKLINAGGTYPDEKLVFIDTEDRIREVIYPDQFETSAPTQARQRLEQDRVLKGVVHVSAINVGPSHGPRLSIVEYLPDQRLYQYRYTPTRGAWEAPELEELTENYQRLWNNGEEES